MSQSNLNSFQGVIGANSSFVGKKEVINSNISLICVLKYSVDLTLNIYQSPDGVNYIKTNTYLTNIALNGPTARIQFYIEGLWGYVELVNNNAVPDNDVILRTIYTANNHDGTITQPTYVNVVNTVPAPITGIVEVSKINQALPAGANAIGSVSVSNLPATQPVSGTVAISNLPATQPISGTVAVSSIASALPVGTNSIGSVVVSNLPAQPLVYGENNNFVFYPTPANNTPAIYADGTQGTNVAGGWKYTNAITGKINWYCYSSATSATDYKVSQLNSMYTVVNQQSTLGLATAQNPFIIIYTRPTSTATTWYQNKFFFGSNALTDTTGVRLLYTGADPVDVHPEIVAPNRIQLDFKPLLSTSTIALSQNESVWLGTLQTTNNTTPAGSFDFTMQEFGVDWVKTPSVLPIEFNSVVVSGTVAVSSITSALPVGTNSIGSVVVSNLPATQPVSGTVAVSSITSALPVGTNSIGSVVVSNLPATQPVSGTVEVSSITSALPTGTNALGSVSVSNLPATQPVSGTVEVSSITSALPTGTNALGSVVASNLPLLTQAGTQGVFCKVSATYIGDDTTQDSSIVCYATQGPDFLKRLQIADASDIPNNDLRELRTTDNSANISLTAINGKITACNTGAVVISSGTVGLSNSLNSIAFNAPVNAGGFLGATYDMGDNSIVDILLLATGTITTGNIRLDYSADGSNWYPNNTTTYNISGTDPHLTIIGLKTGSRYIRISTGLLSAFRADNLQYTYTSKRS